MHVHYSSGGQTGIELSWFTFYTALKYPVQMLVRLGFATFGFHLSILKSTKLSLRTVIFSRKMSKPTAPYGTWKSPISSKLATESSVRFQEIRLDQKPGVVAGTCFIKSILIRVMYATPNSKIAIHSFTFDKLGL